MRIIHNIFLLVSLFCMVSAKCVPDESGSSVVIRKQIVENDTNNNDNNNNSLECKGLKQKRKLDEKIAKQNIRLQESLQKVEEKWQEILEKKERNQQEEEHIREEKMVKEDRICQEKLRKKLDNIEKKIIKESTLVFDNSSKSGEENYSIDLKDIWNSYSKYALNNSNEIEKETVVNRYLQQELGLDINSTKNEYRQAMIQIIQNDMSNDSAIDVNLHNYIISPVNAVYIQTLSTDLKNKIVAMDNETARFLQNISYPWVNKVQQVIKQKKSVLKSVVEYFKNVLPKWITTVQANTTNSNGTNMDLSPVYNSGAAISSHNVSAIITQGNLATSLPNVLVSNGEESVSISVAKAAVNEAPSGNSGSTFDVGLSSSTSTEALFTVFNESITSGKKFVADPTDAVLSSPSTVVVVSDNAVFDGKESSAAAQSGFASLDDSALANIFLVNAGALTNALFNATFPDIRALAAISSTAASFNMSASTTPTVVSSDGTSVDASALVAVFANATTNVTSTYVASNNVIGTGTIASDAVPTEAVPSSTNESPVSTNESTILVTEASMLPEITSRNHSIVTAADEDIIKEISTSFDPSVDSVVSSTEFGFVNDTEYTENFASTSAP